MSHKKVNFCDPGKGYMTLLCTDRAIAISPESWNDVMKWSMTLFLLAIWVAFQRAKERYLKNGQPHPSLSFIFGLLMKNSLKINVKYYPSSFW